MYLGDGGDVVSALVPDTKSSTISSTPCGPMNVGDMNDHRVRYLRTRTICVDVGNLFTFSGPGFHTYKIIVESISQVDFEDQRR